MNRFLAIVLISASAIFIGCNQQGTTKNSLKFYGQEGPTFALAGTPDPLDFGTVSALTSSTLTLTVTNNGNMLSPTCGTAALSDTTNFSITADTCSATQIAAGANCTINVQALPQSGTSIQGTLNMICGAEIFVHTVSVTATDVSTATINPLTNDFGAVDVFDITSTTLTLTITNLGTTTLTGCSAPVLGGSDAAEFTLSSDSCSTNDLASLSTCTMTLQGTPNTAGNHRCTVTRNCTTGGIVSTYVNLIQMTASDAPSLTLDHASFDFGRVPVRATSRQKTFTFTNIGSGATVGCAAPVLSNTFDFSIVTDNCAAADLVASGGACTVIVEANPQSVGLRTTTLSRTCTTGGLISSNPHSLYVIGVNSLLGFQGAYTNGASGISNMDDVTGTLITPDGAHLYAAGPASNAIVHFTRHSKTGSLTFVSSYPHGGTGGNLLQSPRTISMSPDARFLYVVANTDDNVAVFVRDLSTGTLAHSEDNQDNTGGIINQDAPVTGAVSQDGLYYYVTSPVDHSVVFYNRDITTGTLTFHSTILDGDVCTGATCPVNGMNTAQYPSIAPDQGYVYFPGFGDDGISFFRRDLKTGSLTYENVILDGGADALQGAGVAAISPDGRYVLSTGFTENKIGSFTRNKKSGDLSYIENLEDNVGTANGLNAPTWIAPHPTGHYIFVSAIGTDDALTIIGRNPTDGTFDFIEALTTGGGALLADSISNLPSKDGNFLYASSSTADDTINLYKTLIQDDAILVYRESYPNALGSIVGLDGIVGSVMAPNDNIVLTISDVDDSVSSFSVNSGILNFDFNNRLNGSTGLTDPTHISMAPDGGFAYIASPTDNSLRAIALTSVGTLTLGEIHQDGVSSITTLGGANSSAICNAGTFLYVTAETDDSLTSFTRNTTTGSLTVLETFTDGINSVDGLNGAIFVMLSPDEASLYVVGRDDNAVALFSRDTTTGTLSYVGIAQNGVSSVTNMTAPTQLDIALSNDSLYVLSPTDSAVVVFSRNTVTGALTYVENQQTGVSGVQNMGLPSSLALGPKDQVLYVTSASQSAVAVFERNSVDFKLNFHSSLVDGEKGVDGLATANHVTTSSAGSLVLISGKTDDALTTLVNRSDFRGVLSFESGVTDGLVFDALSGAIDVVVSPDNQNVYVAAFDEDSVAVLTKPISQATVTNAQTVIDGAGGVNGLDGAYALAITSDGRSLYAVGSADNGLAVFQRDIDTGTLAFVEAEFDGASLANGLLNVRDVVISPDNRFVYTAAYGEDAIGLYLRDLSTGTVTYGSIAENGVGGVTNMRGPNSMAMSPAGNHLYVASVIDHSVVVFSRDAATGSLTWVETQTDGSNSVTNMQLTFKVLLSPDGLFLYALGASDDAIVQFARDPKYGTLTYVDNYANASGLNQYMDTPKDMAISPDGHHLFVTSAGSSAVTVFRRNLDDGVLIFTEVRRINSGGITTMDGAYGVGISPDGRSVYITGENDHSLTIFDRYP